jgi:hypothetical protein
VAEASYLLEAGLAEALIRVAIIVVSWRTVGANSSDADVLHLADALLGEGAVELIHALARHDAACLGVLIIGLARKTSGAGALDHVVALRAVALAAVEVVDLVCSALDSADTLVDVVDLTGRALGAEVVDEVEAGLADAAT